MTVNYGNHIASRSAIPNSDNYYYSVDSGMEFWTHIGYTIHSHTYTARYPVGWATYQTTDNSVYTYTQPGRTEVTATYTYTWWYNPDEEMGVGIELPSMIYSSSSSY